MEPGPLALGAQNLSHWTTRQAGLRDSSFKTRIHWSPKVKTVTDLFSADPKSLWTVTAAMKLKDAFSLEDKL